MLTEDNPRLIFRDMDDPADSWEDSMADAVAARITEVYWYTRGTAELPELLAAIPMLVGRAVEVHGAYDSASRRRSRAEASVAGR